jgi:hypothetical protein
MLLRGTLAALAFTLLATGSPGDAVASAGPRFELDECAWRATHVVVVSEGPSIDGHVTVVESWVGPLAPGTELHLPGLAEVAPEGRRRLKQTHLKGLVLTGARMVLFLETDPRSGKPSSASGHGDVDSSVCWIEQD